MQYMQKLAKFIKQKRLHTEISLNKFALSIGLAGATLSRIENFKLEIKLQTLIKIASGFNQSPSELLAEFEKTVQNELENFLLEGADF